MQRDRISGSEGRSACDECFYQSHELNHNIRFAKAGAD